MLTINLEWDANALAAPQSFRDGVQAAANILEAAIDNPITVNIEVGYGEFDLNGPQYQPLTSDESFGGPALDIEISYPALRAALAANETSATDDDAVAALTNAASLDGQSTFDISSALAKAFGAIPATDPAIDGNVGFPASFTGDVLIDAAIIEEVHALGLINAGGDLGLFAYTSAGVHSLPSYYTSATPAYFSLDGGVTNLANYDVSFDDTLFENQPGDALDAPDQSSTTLTPLDLSEIDAIGFDVTSTPVLATPTSLPTTSSSTAAVNVRDVGVFVDASIPAASLIASVSVPAGDVIPAYAFYDSGSGNGHFALNGVAEPDDQFIDVLNTQLNTLVYVGGAAPGSETLFVSAFDYEADNFTQGSASTATTVATTDTVAGAGGGVGLSIAFNTAADAIEAAAILNDISASIIGRRASVYTAGSGAPTAPSGTAILEATTGYAGALGTYTAFLSSATSATALTGGALANETVITGTGGLTFTASALGGGGLVQAGGGNNLFFAPASGGGTWTIRFGTGANTIVGGSSNDTIAAGGGANLEFLGTGTDSVAAAGIDTIVSGTGRATVDATGPGALVFAGSGGIQFTAAAGASTLLAFAGTTDTLDGAGGTMLAFTATATHYFGGSGADTVVGIGAAGSGLTVSGGSGNGLYFGTPSGSNSIFGGTGSATIFGGGAGDVLSTGGSGTNVLAAGAGAETISAAGSSGTNTLFLGAGPEVAVGGSGANAYQIGSGAETITGAGTANLYVLDSLTGTTRSVMIDNFNPAQDFLDVNGFQSPQAAVASQVSVGGNSVVTLADGTQLTFVGLANFVVANSFT